MAATVNVNGKIADERQAVVSVFDHGFLYGEGVYETLRTYHHRPFLLDRHLQPLRHRDCVTVVFAHEDYWQTVHAGPVERLVKRARAGRALAESSYCYRRLVTILERCSYANRMQKVSRNDV